MNYRDWMGLSTVDAYRAAASRTSEGCRVVRGGDGHHGAQGLAYSAGISAESAVARTDPNEQESVLLLPGLDGLVTRS